MGHSGAAHPAHGEADRGGYQGQQVHAQGGCAAHGGAKGCRKGRLEEPEKAASVVQTHLLPGGRRGQQTDAEEDASPAG